MSSPINTLLMVWLAIAVAMIIVRVIRRRRVFGRSDPTGDHDQLAISTGDGAQVSGLPHRSTSAGAFDVSHPPLFGSGSSGMIKADREIDPSIDLLVVDRVRTLTDMLSGIKLPYDLTPVTSVVEDPDRHLIFLTTHSNAGEVGRRFADELEVLGFDFQPVDADQAIAVRDTDVVSMKIVPDADRVESGNAPRYGAAGPGDVALELWIGRSPTPPSPPA